MAMARDGLLPSFFLDIDKRTHVLVKSTIAFGILAGLLAFFIEVSELAGMVSVGTLLAFTVVGVSVLIIRYIPPTGEALRPFIEGSSSALVRDGHNTDEVDEDIAKGTGVLGEDHCQVLLKKKEPVRETTADKRISLEKIKGQQGRNLAAWFISILYIGALVLASAASAEGASSFCRIVLCGLGAIIFIAGITGLAYIGQDRAADKLGQRRFHLSTCSILACCQHTYKHVPSYKSWCWHVDLCFNMASNRSSGVLVLWTNTQLIVGFIVHSYNSV